MSCKKSTTLFELCVEFFKLLFPFNVSRVEAINMFKTFNVSLTELFQIHSSKEQGPLFPKTRVRLKNYIAQWRSRRQRGNALR